MGTAAFGKTRQEPLRPRLRAQRGRPLQPRRAVSTVDVPQEEWYPIPVPAIVEPEVVAAVQEQWREHRRHARQSRRGALSVLQGLLQCQHCGYAYYGQRLSPRARKGKPRAYASERCLGTDAYRFGGERVCQHTQVRTDLLDVAVWQEVCTRLAHPERLAEEYRRRLQPETRATRTSLATGEAQIGKLRHGGARLIDRYAESRIDKDEFEPRITRLRQRLARLEEQRQAGADEAALQTEFQLIIGRLEDFATKVHSGLEAADWASQRDLIRTLVKRVEVARDQVNIVFRVDPYPDDADPEKKSWQLCRGSDDSSLRRACVRWREKADFDDSCLQPLAQCGGEYWQFGQQRAVVDMVKAAANICVQYPRTTVFPVHSRVHCCDRIHCAAPWSKAIGVGFEPCLPFWFQGRLDDGLHHPVLAGRYAQGSVFPVVFGDIHPADWSGLVPLEAQAFLKQLPAGFGSVVHHSNDACGVFPLVFLGDTSDCQELIGRGSNKQFLEVFHCPPCLVRGGAIDTFLQTSYMTFHGAPLDVSPRSVGGVLQSVR